MYALCGDMPDDTLINGLNYLECCQAEDGHFSRRTNMYTDASNTAYAMIVLNKFDYGKASLPISKGIMWLLENQDEDGSWGANTKKKAYTTTLCLRALHTFYLSGLARFARGPGVFAGLCKKTGPCSRACIARICPYFKSQAYRLPGRCDGGTNSSNMPLKRRARRLPVERWLMPRIC